MDVDDMERRLVEFRLNLDREKRRCIEARMLSQYQKLLQDKLNEDIEPGPDGRQLAANTIQLQCLDDDSLKCLTNFLRNAILMCQREEQHNKFQQVIRDILQESRRQSVAFMEARGQTEPFCLFCASDIHSSCSGPHRHPADPTEGPDDQAEPPVDQDETLVLPRIEFIRQTDSMAEPRAPTGTFTPPPSAAPTPDMGDLLYQPSAPTPTVVQPPRGAPPTLVEQPAATANNSPAQPETGATNASPPVRPTTLGVAVLSNNNGLANPPVLAPQLIRQDNGGPSGLVVASTSRAPQTAGQAARPRADEPVDDSDDEDPLDEMRSLLDNLRESGRMSQSRQKSQQRSQPRDSSPLSKKRKVLTNYVDVKVVRLEQQQQQQQQTEPAPQRAAAPACTPVRTHRTPLGRSSTPVAGLAESPAAIDQSGTPTSPIGRRAERSSLQQQAEHMRRAESNSLPQQQQRARGSRIEDISAMLRCAGPSSSSSVQPVEGGPSRLAVDGPGQPHRLTAPPGRPQSTGGPRITKRTNRRRDHSRH